MRLSVLQCMSGFEPFGHSPDVSNMSITPLSRCIDEGCCGIDGNIEADNYSIEQRARKVQWDQPEVVKCGALLFLICQNSAIALTMRYSQSRKGTGYISRQEARLSLLQAACGFMSCMTMPHSTAVVATEVIKLVAASLIVAYQEGSVRSLCNRLSKDIMHKRAEFLKLFVPAGLYVALNNLAFVATLNLDAATYQVLAQLKILTTAIFSVCILHTKLNISQWLALCLLIIGIALVQLSSRNDQSNMVHSSNTTGFAAVLASCICSGLAGVYFERVLKGSDISVWVRNIELAIIGIGLGLGTVWLQDMEDVLRFGFFSGYDRVVWAVILLQALGGIIVAVVVRYADNILKAFATSMAIILSCLISYTFLGEFNLTRYFLLGAAMVLSSVALYNTNLVDISGRVRGVRAEAPSFPSSKEYTLLPQKIECEQSSNSAQSPTAWSLQSKGAALRRALPVIGAS